MKTRVLLVTLLVASASVAYADAMKKSFRSEQKFSIAAGGVFVLENPAGDVAVEGADVKEVVASITKNVTGATAAALEEGNRQTGFIVGGDGRTRVVRSAVAAGGKTDWKVSVSWRIKVPKRVSVRILTQVSRKITVTGTDGAVYVKNFNGDIILTNTPGTVVAESVNGSMLYRTKAPRGNIALSTVNGSVTVSVGRDVDLRWVGKTAKGDVRTNLPVRGAFFGPEFRGSMNAPGGVVVQASSLMGDVQLLALGERVADVQSLRKAQPTLVTPGGMTTASSPSGTEQELVNGLFQYATNLGDVRVQQIRGDADVFTGAGEVQLGAVSGACAVRSLGGPLQLGEILGQLSATTRAGDVLVDSARHGGTIATQGGSIRLLYTGGPTRLYSGGGDITVRQAAGSIDASTVSGDVWIQVDAASKSEKVEATTQRGNITLNVTPQFAADVEATIITTNPDDDTILSDLSGLSISREDLGGKTRIHATGKINGGGERVVLRATGGDIRISTAPAGPTVVGRR
jgi:DUF4097 and DUF4098 domain-containing protein YvlB